MSVVFYSVSYVVAIGIASFVLLQWPGRTLSTHVTASKPG